MKITFSSAKLAKIFNSNSKMQREFGADIAKKLCIRMTVLAAASNMMEIPTHFQCHPLHGAATRYAISITGNYRLVFAPNHSPLPQKDDGGIDLALVTKITVIEVVDYH
ncbi:MAG: killer suppression protein HigA [bacterium]|nr:killer suppression protein HigA [bacterium]